MPHRCFCRCGSPRSGCHGDDARDGSSGSDGLRSRPSAACGAPNEGATISARLDLQRQHGHDLSRRHRRGDVLGNHQLGAAPTVRRPSRRADCHSLPRRGHDERQRCPLPKRLRGQGSSTGIRSETAESRVAGAPALQTWEKVRAQRRGRVHTGAVGRRFEQRFNLLELRLARSEKPRSPLRRQPRQPRLRRIGLIQKAGSHFQVYAPRSWRRTSVSRWQRPRG
jgi:hypothetical protein